MSDPIVIVESVEPNVVVIDGSVTDNATDYSVVVENIEPYSISIETSFVENIGILEIERTSSANISILGPLTIINVGDLPDVPFSKITGNIDVARISNLDNYLDSYSFDCGTP
jgi:hypothetical protein